MSIFLVVISGASASVMYRLYKLHERKRAHSSSVMLSLSLSPQAHVLVQIGGGRAGLRDGSSDPSVRGRVTLWVGGNCMSESRSTLGAVSHAVIPCALISSSPT